MLLVDSTLCIILAQRQEADGVASILHAATCTVVKWLKLKVTHISFADKSLTGTIHMVSPNHKGGRKWIQSRARKGMDVQIFGKQPSIRWRGQTKWFVKKCLLSWEVVHAYQWLLSLVNAQVIVFASSWDFSLGIHSGRCSLKRPLSFMEVNIMSNSDPFKNAKMVSGADAFSEIPPRAWGM